jgi:predicted ATPase
VTAEMTVERGGVRAVWFTANALFEGSLGPVDYLRVARRYDVVLVQGLAPFDLRLHNQVMCFANVLIMCC